MQVTRTTIVLDTDDLEAESSFWSSLLGGTVDKDDDWHSLESENGPRLAFQLAPDHVAPQWPDGEPQQIHLDIVVPDIRAAHAEAMEAGARLLEKADDLDAVEGFQVYADPSGHPFCLCWE